MKNLKPINPNIPEEIQTARNNRAAQIKGEKRGQSRLNKVFAAMEKLENIRRGQSNLAISQESNKQYQKVAVTRSLAEKLSN